MDEWGAGPGGNSAHERNPASFGKLKSVLGVSTTRGAPEVAVGSTLSPSGLNLTAT